MITNWIKMKKAKVELSLKLYTYANSLLAEQTSLIELARGLYISLKDTPVNDLQDKLILAIAELAHEQAQKDKETDSVEQ